MGRLTYDEFLKESQQALNACIYTRSIINAFVKNIKKYQRLYGRSFYIRGVVNSIETHANWLCDCISTLYIESTSDLYDAQKRHVQRLIKKEVRNADTDK